MLALIGAIEAMHATHLFESGTASGVSTELLATYFGDRRHPLKITTVDIGTLYGIAQHNATRERLSCYATSTAGWGTSAAQQVFRRKTRGAAEPPQRVDRSFVTFGPAQQHDAKLTKGKRKQTSTLTTIRIPVRWDT